jgi:cyclic pyranopterin monophosphate synthase
MGIVDISHKEIVLRKAMATGTITLKKTTITKVLNNEIEKGNPLAIAEAAALLAVKQTPYLIPHCHPIPIQSVTLVFKFHEDAINLNLEVTSKGSTGVEIEAITSVSIALCTIWDMVKYLEKDENGQYPDTSIHSIRVIKKEKYHV